MKSQIDTNIFIVGDFNILFSPIDISFIQKQNREILELSDVKNQRVITSVCRTSHINTKEYTFFPAPYGTLSKIDNILRNKASLNKHQIIEKTSCILSD